MLRKEFRAVRPFLSKVVQSIMSRLDIQFKSILTIFSIDAK